MNSLGVYVLKRLLSLIPVLLVISFMVFSMLHLAPGDPVMTILGTTEMSSISVQEMERIRQEWGLNDPFLVQYVRYISRAVVGDLGQSYRTDTPVLAEVRSRLPNTIALALSSMLLSILIAVPLGVVAAVRKDSWIDTGSSLFATLGVSIPNFWFGLMLILLFALSLGWLPSHGVSDLDKGAWQYVRHLILPAITLGLALMAIVTRMTRSSMLDVVRQDYIRTARAKGLNERSVIYKHALKAALIPVITVVGIQFGNLLGGAVVTETIFAWPGVGRLAITAIRRRDFPMIQGNTLVLCLFFVLVNLVVDVIYALLDPRIIYS